MPRSARAVAVAAGCALAGCGGGGDHHAKPGPSHAVAPAQDRADTRHADPRAVRVIRGWVSAERLDEPEQAASYFAIPAVVYNGGAPLLLRDLTAVREFNHLLPCGAVMLRVSDVRGWSVVRFRLIDRPGASCDGVGHTASTAFGILDGRIVAWIRIGDRVPPRRAVPGLSPRELVRQAVRQGRPNPIPTGPAV
jgi:hypothetical protein